MSRKNTKKKRVEFSDIKWVFDNLTAHQLKEHDKSPLTPDEILGKLTQFVEDDFKVSIKWDSYNDCLLATAVCDIATANNAGLAISSRGEDVTDVLSILCFKYFNIAERNLKELADKMPKGVRG